jgi:hypothetical protein
MQIFLHGRQIVAMDDFYLVRFQVLTAASMQMI